MHVRIDVTYMYTDFGGRDLSSFGNTGTLKTAKFPFRTMVIKNFNQSESAQKNHACKD